MYGNDDGDYFSTYNVIVVAINKIKHYHLYHDVVTQDVDHNFSLTGAVIAVVKIFQGYNRDLLDSRTRMSTVQALTARFLAQLLRKFITQTLNLSYCYQHRVAQLF